MFSLVENAKYSHRKILFLIAIVAQMWICSDSNGQVTTSVTEPFEESKIASVEQGVIQQVLISEGDAITSQQPLAELDKGVLVESRRLAEEKANTKSKLDAANASLKLRKAQKENLQSLIESGHANPFEVDQVIAKYEQALADYESVIEDQKIAKVELAKIEREIYRRTIRSPISGIVTEIHKRPGEYVAVSDPNFATVVQLDRLRVRFYLTANQTENLKKGDSVEVVIGESKVATNGKIEFVSPIVEPKTGLAKVNVLIENRKRKFRSGVVCRWVKKLEPQKFASSWIKISDQDGDRR